MMFLAQFVARLFSQHFELSVRVGFKRSPQRSRLKMIMSGERDDVGLHEGTLITHRIIIESGRVFLLPNVWLPKLLHGGSYPEVLPY
jgi:hypothetical protein